MVILLDSLRIFRKSCDSLRKVIEAEQQMQILKTAEPQVQAAIIIAITTVFTVILGFLFKDYWIPGLIELRTKRREGQEVFKRYKIYIFKAALFFAYRLIEIFRTRSHYLWKNKPQSEFYDYKYKSTVYRLCVLLGWIRAYRLEESSIVIEKTDEKIQAISTVIESIEKSLADGQGVEMYAAKEICGITGVDINNVNGDNIKKFSIEIDHQIQIFQEKYNKEFMSELSLEQKNSFVQAISDSMQKVGLKETAIEDVCVDRIIKKVSIRVGLIYRDWQIAIGDIMLTKSQNNDGPKYEVIGYGKFEEMWSRDKATEEKKWLLRAEQIFENLDLRLDDDSDSRIPQISRLYISIYNLLKELYLTDVGIKPIKPNEFSRIPQSINPV